MENEYLVTACVLLLSGLAAVLHVSLRTNRRLHEHLQDEQNAYHQLLRHTESKPPPRTGTFVLSDREVAQREQQLLRSSRQRASVLAAGAPLLSTRLFRRGSRSSPGSLRAE